MRRAKASMRLSLGSVGLMRTNSESASASVAMTSCMRVLQKTMLPAPIIAILAMSLSFERAAAARAAPARSVRSR
jgi:hypothetical protein